MSKHPEQHVRIRDGKAHEVVRHGGTDAREWRGQVARLAMRPPEGLTRTLKFPLDIKIDHSVYGSSSALYAAVEGVGPGSLLFFLLQLHRVGFRVFQNVAQADAFRQRDAFHDDAFLLVAEEVLGTTCKKLCPAELALFLKERARRVGAYAAPELASRLYVRFTGKRLDERADAVLSDVARRLAERLAKEFASWPDMYADPARALAAMDEVFQQFSPSFPRLAPAGAGSGQAGPGTPLAFDPSAPLLPVPEDPALLLHLVVSRYANERLGREGAIKTSALSKAVGDDILSPMDNALSWLFNAGLGSFRDTAPTQIAQDYGVPAGRLSELEAVCVAARAVPPPPFLSLPHYADFRRTVSGKVRSWVSNYLARMETLRDQLDAASWAELPPASAPAAVAEILSGLNETESELRAAVLHRNESCAAALDLHRQLAGLEPGLDAATIGLFETLIADVEDVDGRLRSIHNQIHQIQEVSGDAFPPELRTWLEATAGAKNRIFALPHISGGAIEPGTEIARLSELLEGLLRSRRRMQEMAARGATRDRLIETWQRREADRGAARVRSGAQQVDFEELALRRLLSQFVALSRRVSPSTRDRIRDALLSAGIFVDQTLKSGRLERASTTANRLFINQQGRVYMSPWAPNRHQPIPVNLATTREFDFLGFLWQLEGALRDELDHTATNPIVLRDWLQVGQVRLMFLLDAGPASYPSAEVRSVVDTSILTVPGSLAALLKGESVSRESAKRLATLISGHLATVTFQSLRQSFIVRHKFSLIGQTQLAYVPRDRPWAMPAKYAQAKGPIAHAIAQSLVLTDEPDLVDVPGTVAKLAAGGLTTANAALLVQLPHEWRFAIKSQQVVAPECKGLLIGKQQDTAKEGAVKARSPRYGTIEGTARLIGPPSFTSQLNELLMRASLSTGDITLILDWHFAQQLAWDGQQGRPIFSVEPDGCRVEIAVPLTDHQQPQDVALRSVFDRIVSIDLGERRIGYAVFDLPTCLSAGKLEPATDPATGVPLVGSIAVPAVRRLISAVRTYRGKSQPNQKITQRYSSRLEKLRENVVGDVSQRIDALCARYGAFPVLESSVSNFQTGSRQLDLVYGSVLHRYTYSDVDAHKLARAQYWQGADSWAHPYLMSYEWDKVNSRWSRKSKQLKLYPGASVNPAGTSQVCCHCGRNPIDALRALGGRVEVGDGGAIGVSDGEIRVMSGSQYSEAERRQADRQKRRLSLNRPAPAGRYSLQEAERYLRMTLRQGHPSLLAKDTTQSRYQCVYTDCGKSYHADEGAAINIGRKWLTERIDQAESKKRLCTVAG